MFVIRTKKNEYDDINYSITYINPIISSGKMPVQYFLFAEESEV